MFKKVSLKFQITIAILLPIILIVIISNLFIQLYTGKISKDLSYKILEESSSKESNSIKYNIEKHLYNVMGLKINIENLYRSGVRDREVYKQITSVFFDNLPKSINGLSIAFEPNAIDNDADYINSDNYKSANGRFNYYISRNGESYLSIDTFNVDYYTEPKRTGEVYISGIYNSTVNKDTRLFTLCIPIKPDNNFIGVIYVDIFADSITSLLNDNQLFKGTTIELYDQHGNVVYDSYDAEHISKNIYEVYPHYKQYNVFENMQSGKFLIMEFYGEEAHINYTYAFSSIDIVNGVHWGLAISTPKNEILNASNIMRIVLIIILIVIIILLCLLIPFIISGKVSNIISALSKDIVALSDGDLTREIPANFN